VTSQSNCLPPIKTSDNHAGCDLRRSRVVGIASRVGGNYDGADTGHGQGPAEIKPGPETLLKLTGSPELPPVADNAIGETP
jgi:hypothetical protein